MIEMVPCPHCNELRKPAGLSRHIWRAHTEEGQNHIGFRKGTHDAQTRARLSKLRQAQPAPFLGKSAPHTGLTMEEFHGPEKAVEIRQRIAEKMNGNRNGKHRGDRTATYKGLSMDSWWEVGVAAYLDRQGIDWRHEERSFRLSDGRHYNPDFFIYENGEFSHLIEVKGYFREASRKKFDQFKLEYPEIRVELWDKPVLFSKGILDRQFRTIGV